LPNGSCRAARNGENGTAAPNWSPAPAASEKPRPRKGILLIAEGVSAWGILRVAAAGLLRATPACWL